MKKLTPFLKRLQELTKVIDQEISEYWRDFFADREERGGKKR